MVPVSLTIFGYGKFIMNTEKSTANQLSSGADKGSTENTHPFYTMLSNEMRRNQTLEAASNGFRQVADEFTRAFADWGPRKRRTSNRP